MPAAERVGYSPTPHGEDAVKTPPKAFVHRGEFLGQIVERAAQLAAFTHILVAVAVENADDTVDRVLGAAERLEPVVGDHTVDQLINDCVAQFGLVGEVVVERALGDAGVGQDTIKARRTKSIAMDFLEGGLEHPLPGFVGVALTYDHWLCSVVGLRPIYIPTSMHVSAWPVKSRVSSMRVVRADEHSWGGLCLGCLAGWMSVPSSRARLCLGASVYPHPGELDYACVATPCGPEDAVKSHWLVVVVLLCCVPLQGATLAEDSKVSTGIRLLEAWIKSDLLYKAKPGLSIAIVHDQELVWSRGFGYADIERKIPTTTQTAYRMASNTKMFTAMALMQLRDAGKLELHDPVTKHLSWFRPKGMEQNSRPITVWNLLTHTSGLPREAAAPYWTDNEFPSQQELRELIRTQEVIYRPEKRWKYSNLALSLGGEIVEAISGEPYAEYVRKRILQPLGMTSSAIGVSSIVAAKMAVGYGRRMPDGSRDIRPESDCKAINPAAGLVSNVEDMARFAMLQFREGGAGGEQVLSATTLNEMHRVRWLQPDWKRGWGIGFSTWRTSETTFVGHGGSLAGYRTQTSFSPADKIAVLVLTNSDDGDAGAVAAHALKLVAPAVKKATAKEKKKEFDPTWSHYAGVYRSPWGDTQVLVGDGELLMFSPLASDLSQGIGKLIPVEGGVFRLASTSGGAAVGELIQFETNDSGAVTRIKVGDNYSRRVSQDER